MNNEIIFLLVLPRLTYFASCQQRFCGDAGNGFHGRHERWLRPRRFARSALRSRERRRRFPAYKILGSSTANRRKETPLIITRLASNRFLMVCHAFDHSSTEGHANSFLSFRIFFFYLPWGRCERQISQIIRRPRGWRPGHQCVVAQVVSR